MKQKLLVKCPECSYTFFTCKDKAQCGECGNRFVVKENVIKV